MARLFGTDGVRGVVNENLDPVLALKLGMAIGTLFGEGAKILVGRDIRCGGQMLKSAVIAGLLSSGVKVYDADLTPTPALQYVVKNEDFDGGVMITASHNPPEYNGVKVIDSDGIEISRDKEVELEEILFNERFKRVKWSSLTRDVVSYPYVNDMYVKAIVDLVDRDKIRSKGFKIVVDPANSVSSLTSPKIARELGVKVYTVNGNLDPLFPGREPEPTYESLKETSRVVISLNADFGVAHDGDGDRAIFIDDRGRVIWGDRSAVILAKHLMEKYPGLPRRIYTAVSSSTIIEDYLREYNVEVVWLKVGSVDIARAMLMNGDALCGFEENGGFMFPKHQYVRDGGLALALMLETLADWNMKLSDIYDTLPKMYAIKTKIPLERSRVPAILEKVKSVFSGYRQVIIDGVKIIGEDFWVLVRPSGTEPVLRIMIEAVSEEYAKKILGKIMDLVKES